jgi:hypothetical protein
VNVVSSNLIGVSNCSRMDFSVCEGRVLVNPRNLERKKAGFVNIPSQR